MFVNIIGECDTRPVVYTLMKFFQSMGDVLVVSDNSKLRRLYDIGDIYGHYQNCMIAVTEQGLDDFLDDFPYRLDDFSWTICDNVLTSDAALTIYVKGLADSDQQLSLLETLEEYSTIELFSNKLRENGMSFRLEQFEAFRNMPVVNLKLTTELMNILSPILKRPAKQLIKIATKSVDFTETKKKGFFK